MACLCFSTGLSHPGSIVIFQKTIKYSFPSNSNEIIDRYSNVSNTMATIIIALFSKYVTTGIAEMW